MQRRNKITVVIGIIIILVALILWKQMRGQFFQSDRTRYIFINETNHHEHDLAFKMSLKLAESRSGIENALVLLKELPNKMSIEDAAAHLFQKWRIGANRSGKGILYLYSEKENLLKIEVSYALEPNFPDVFCHRLEQAAQTYMLSEIPQDFISELLITMSIQGQDAAKAKEFAFETPEWLKSTHLSGGAGVQVKGYQRSLADYLLAVQHLSKQETEEYAPSAQLSETLRLYLKSLESGIGDPNLPLLTEGSKIFRFIVPRTRAQQERVYSYFQKASPPEIFVNQSIAVAAFQPGVANLPIVFRLGSDGLWYVDEPKSWTYYHRFENSNDLFTKYSSTPFLNELAKMKHPQAKNSVYRNYVGLPKAPEYPYSLEKVVNEYEAKMQRNSKNPETFATLGELYLFEVNWLSKAVEMFQTAERLAPENLAYHWRLFDLYINSSRMEDALRELQYLAERLPKDRYVQDWWESYRREYRFDRNDFPAETAVAFSHDDTLSGAVQK